MADTELTVRNVVEKTIQSPKSFYHARALEALLNYSEGGKSEERVAILQNAVVSLTRLLELESTSK